MPFIKRGVYERLRFHSETTPQHYVLEDITSVGCSYLKQDVVIIFCNFEITDLYF